MSNRPLRFCMITTFYPPFNFGGDGIFVHRLSEELARQGHSVEVIHCVDSYRLLAGGRPAGACPNHPNVTVHGIRSGFGPLSPLATQQTGRPLFTARQIRRILDKGFDVIHYHNVSLVGGPAIFGYGRAIKLCTLHDYWLVCQSHLLLKFNWTPCTRESCLLCALAHKRPPQFWRHTRLLAKALKHIDAFIHLTTFSREMHRQRGLDLPFVHLPFFLGESADGWASTDGSAGAGSDAGPYFLFAGRLEKLKGAQTLISLFRRYPRARLLIAGAGGYETRLRDMAKGCANIRFLGELPYRRLCGFYAQATAVIVPSLYYEISPLVIVEAARHKTPVIVRNLGGMPELAAESGGLVYDTETELVAVMDRLLSDPSHRRDVGLRGFEAYQQKWTAAAHVERYLALIAGIAAQRGQSLAASTTSAKVQEL